MRRLGMVAGVLVSEGNEGRTFCTRYKPMERLTPYLAVLVFGFLGAVSFAGSVTMTDGDFADSSLSTLTSNDGEAYIIIQGDGNPGSCLNVTTVTGDTKHAWGIAVNNGFEWNPTTRGPLGSVEMSIDVNSISAWGNGQEIHLVVLQDGRYFGAPITTFYTGSLPRWERISLGPFGDQSFAEMIDADIRLWDPSLNPDFSNIGSPLLFGFGAENDRSGEYTQIYDNWEMTMHYVESRLPGDMNLDGEVNGLDVEPFVYALLNEPFNLRADMNGDGAVSGLDVDPFVAVLLGEDNGTQPIPEPSTLFLALVALGVVGVLLIPRGNVAG
jgi:hypothetical protein